MQIKEIYDFLDKIAPFNTMSDWDNCGFAIGSLDNKVTKIVIALDVTSKVIDFATANKAELVISHHPILFTPPKQIKDGSLIDKAIKSGITFISSHTPLDKTVNGVNYALGRKLGAKNIVPTEVDFMKIGTILPLTANEFADVIKYNLGGCVRFNDCGKKIEKVAFCSGGGGKHISEAISAGVDALVTGEAAHHHFLEAAENNVSLFVAGHHETENPICYYLKQILSEEFNSLDEIMVIDTNPTKIY